MQPQILRLFKDFAQRIGLGEPEFLNASADHFTLRIDNEDFTLQHSEKTDAIYCVHELCTLPDAREKEFALLRYIAEKNCFFRSTGIGILGAKGRSLYYSARVPTSELTAASLQNFVEACVNLCEALRKDCQSLLETESSSEGGAPFDANAMRV